MTRQVGGACRVPMGMGNTRERVEGFKSVEEQETEFKDERATAGVANNYMVLLFSDKIRKIRIDKDTLSDSAASRRS